MNRLLRGTMVVTAGLVVLKALGWVREVILAYYFGTSGELDALLVAMTVPTFVSGTLGLAIGTAIVPVYHRWRASTDMSSGTRLAFIAGLLLAGTIPLTVAASVGAPLLVRWMAPGFDAENFVHAATMTRWLSVSAVPLTLSAFWTALTQAERRFEAQMAGTAVGTVVTVASIWWLSPLLGVTGAAVGFVAGAVTQLVFFGAWQGLHHRVFPLAFRVTATVANDARDLWKLMAPIILGATFSQVRVVVDRLVASGLQIGAIAALNYANRVVSLPVILLSDGLMIVFFPSLSRQLARGDTARARELLSLVYRLLVVTFLPITVLTLVLAPEAVTVLFQRGAFDADATARTAALVRVYALGLIPTVTSTASMRVFHASVDTLTPVAIGLVSTVANIAGNFILAGPLGARGIALATSGAIALRAWLLTRMLVRRLPDLGLRDTPSELESERLFRLRLGLSLAVAGSAVLLWFRLRPFIGLPWLALLTGALCVGVPYSAFWWWSRSLIWPAPPVVVSPPVIAPPAVLPPVVSPPVAAPPARIPAIPPIVRPPVMAPPIVEFPVLEPLPLPLPVPTVLAKRTVSAGRRRGQPQISALARRMLKQ